MQQEEQQWLGCYSNASNIAAYLCVKKLKWSKMIDDRELIECPFDDWNAFHGNNCERGGISKNNHSVRDDILHIERVDFWIICKDERIANWKNAHLGQFSKNPQRWSHWLRENEIHSQSFKWTKWKKIANDMQRAEPLLVTSKHFIGVVNGGD